MDMQACARDTVLVKHREITNTAVVTGGREGVKTI
jgi:hypothetical protein